MMNRYPDRIELLERTGKLGLGSAYRFGFRHALELGVDFICELDADFSHDPRDLPSLIAPVRDGRADVPVGSPYIQGVRVINWPLSRLLLSYGAGIHTRLTTRLAERDLSSADEC